jgi:cystathionine beta-lyase/cystathionine gamma-synthase
MVSSAELPTPSLANLCTVSELDASLDAKGTFEPGEGLYPRDGTATVSDIEKLVSSVTIPDQRLNVIWSSGMAAVREAVNFAAVSMADSGTRNLARSFTLSQPVFLSGNSAKVLMLRGLIAESLMKWQV